ncbi:hypothetical protein [Agromyces humi]|uniref:hypothetical protein n=1 Tax=Agromyces humi TaxID=1766800 RepID=UPI00135A1B9A|nr:hypothetical protein [Agromyces humi]
MTDLSTTAPARLITASRAEDLNPGDMIVIPNPGGGSSTYLVDTVSVADATTDDGGTDEPVGVVVVQALDTHNETVTVVMDADEEITLADAAATERFVTDSRDASARRVEKTLATALPTMHAVSIGAFTLALLTVVATVRHQPAIAGIALVAGGAIAAAFPLQILCMVGLHHLTHSLIPKMSKAADPGE